MTGDFPSGLSEGAARRTAIVTDSTADLPRDFAQQNGITVVPLTVTLDGESHLDGVDITPEQFYPRLRAARGIATTSQPSPGTFVEVYRRLLAEHDEVLSIHISSRLSGTFSAAVQGAAMTEEARVSVIDSRLASISLGLVVLAAAQLSRDGLDAASIRARVEQLVTGVSTFFTVSTLEYLRRGGRIGRASALVGGVLQVKPVLTVVDGEVTPLERVRTYDRAVARVIELAEQKTTGGRLCAIVAHAAEEDVADRIARALAPKAESLLIQPMGPVVGTHAGPGAVGVGCYVAELAPLKLGVRLPTTARADNASR